MNITARHSECTRINCGIDYGCSLSTSHFISFLKVFNLAIEWQVSTNEKMLTYCTCTYIYCTYNKIVNNYHTLVYISCSI